MWRSIMSQILLDKKAINLLRENPYVKEVSEKAITYTAEFREKIFSEYEFEKSLNILFIQSQVSDTN